MTATYTQLKRWYDDRNAYDAATKKNAQENLWRELGALISSAGEVEFLKAEIERLIGEKVALDVKLREAQAQQPGWTIPPVSHTPPRLDGRFYTIPHDTELGRHSFVPDDRDPAVCGLVTAHGPVPMICGYWEEDH